ncbi:unnamed protein product [Meloidogyne enterolobii]|uniref:Uncharacterized protein n=1 Tax=Meloidogyne enterolobii TaxID=390850 RepID=A0ACB0Z8K0_MELEN
MNFLYIYRYFRPQLLKTKPKILKFLENLDNTKSNISAKFHLSRYTLDKITQLRALVFLRPNTPFPNTFHHSVANKTKFLLLFSFYDFSSFFTHLFTHSHTITLIKKSF